MCLGLGAWGGVRRSRTATRASAWDSAVLALKTLFDPASAGSIDEEFELRLGPERFRARVANGALRWPAEPRPEHPARGDRHRPREALAQGALARPEVMAARAPIRRPMRIEGDRSAARRFLALFPAPTPAPAPAGGLHAAGRRRVARTGHARQVPHVAASGPRDARNRPARRAQPARATHATGPRDAHKRPAQRTSRRAARTSGPRGAHKRPARRAQGPHAVHTSRQRDPPKPVAPTMHRSGSIPRGNLLFLAGAGHCARRRARRRPRSAGFKPAPWQRSRTADRACAGTRAAGRSRGPRAPG